MLNVLKKKNKTKINIYKMLRNERGEGFLGLIIVSAIVLIIAAFVILPGLRALANTMMNALSDWWTNTISGQLFPAS